MKQIFTILLGIALLFCAKAQTQQLLTNTAYEFGFVDATKTIFYTYNDIDKNKPNPPSNFELKKFDPVTNTFSVYLSVPNTNQYAQYSPLTVVNGKCLLAADFNASYSNARRNYFVFNGVQYDSLFPKGYVVFKHGGTIVNNGDDIYLNSSATKAYFAIDTIGGIGGIYETDFTKAGTTQLCSFSNYRTSAIYGINSTLYFTEGGILFQLLGSIKTAIDSSINVMSFFMDKINNALYIYKTNSNYIKSVIKINALNQISTLPNAPNNALRMIGKVGNKMAFLPQLLQGIELYDLNALTTSIIYKQNTINEPNSLSPAIAGFGYSTQSNNHLYLYTNGGGFGSKLWVTDGNTVKELNYLQYSAINSLGLLNTFCGENWLLQQKIGGNQSSMISYDPSTNSSIACFQPSNPAFNCVYSSAYEVNNQLYVLSQNNLYGVTNCSISSDINTIKKETVFIIYPNPCKASFNIQIHEAFQNGTLTIYNSLGQTCLSQNIQNYSRAMNFKTAGLSSGIYNVVVSDGRNLMVSKKLVIE
jgi:ribosomal protein L33